MSNKQSRLALKIVVTSTSLSNLWPGNREQVLGDFTFRYILRFFSVYLLIQNSPIQNAKSKKSV
ncbi:hypothetical protein FJR04_19835 [Anabaena sp. UHCC 0204]|nr:hypothetical protein [Anabaena sp. UHCC 0204]